MAAGGFKEFVAGETLDEDEINDYLMQGVLVFAGTAARESAIGTPVEGQFAFLKDSDALTFYDGSQWAELSTTPGAAVVSGTTGSPTVGTVSSGGTTYNVYSFTGSGSITFSEAGFAELLVVGGGGGGGIGIAGGGGGGGHLSISEAYFPIGTATVIVGAGGAAPNSIVVSDNFGASGITGNTSRIGDFFSPGGGGGAGGALDFPDDAFRSTSGQNGGSGGGGSGLDTGSVFPAGNGISPIGNNGGTGVGTGATAAGGGGGGAGAAGSNGTSSTGGNGGNGLASSITGTSVTRAGGGGGGSTPTSGSGGTGGGGAGANSGSATSGTANTGGGGGGNRSSGSAAGGSGGSGIVIVRVAV